MRIVEALLILAVTALDLSVVAGRVGLDELVANTQFRSSGFKQRRQVPLAVGETVGELEAVVRLHAFDLNAFSRKVFDNLVQKVSRRIRALFGVSSENAVAGVFVNGCVLVQLQVWIRDATAGNDFDVDLDALTRILHLFIGFGLVGFFFAAGSVRCSRRMTRHRLSTVRL